MSSQTKERKQQK